MIKLAELDNVRNKIAKKCYINNTKLYCNRCKNNIDITIDQFDKYLKTGWPSCCNEVMQLVNK